MTDEDDLLKMMEGDEGSQEPSEPKEPSKKAVEHYYRVREGTSRLKENLRKTSELVQAWVQARDRAKQNETLEKEKPGLMLRLGEIKQQNASAKQEALALQKTIEEMRPVPQPGQDLLQQAHETRRYEEFKEVLAAVLDFIEAEEKELGRLESNLKTVRG